MNDANDHCELTSNGFELKLDISMPGSLDAVEGVVAQIIGIVRELNFDDEKEYGIALCIHEALVNAVRYGAKSDPQKSIRCCVAWNEKKGLVMVVRDPGPGFDPGQVPECMDAENVYSDHGRGLRLMRELMDQVEFRHNGSEILLRKA